MRKAFKVATVFTGAAACATVFTPATAMATTTRPEQINGIIRNCPAGYNTSVHLYWFASEHHGPTCVGGSIQYAFPSPRPRYYSLCPGNNSGFFNSAAEGSTYSYGHQFHVSRAFPLVGGAALSIDNFGWSGTHQCHA